MSKYERCLVISKEKLQSSFALFFPCSRSGLYVGGYGVIHRMAIFSTAAKKV